MKEARGSTALRVSVVACVAILALSSGASGTCCGNAMGLDNISLSY